MEPNFGLSHTWSSFAGTTAGSNIDISGYGNVTVTGYVGYTGPLPQLEDPRTSYLGIYCQPCTIPRGTSTTISVGLFNSTGVPISGAPVSLSYRLANNTLRPIITQNTNATGGFSYSWASSNVPIGSYQLVANYTGLSANYDPSIQSVPISMTTPTKILPGGSITFSYPYFFNVTGA